ncbi:MAG: tRNA lysidine(34) synthetase TilS [Firmicutes bacterium]|nr:tRNA lysidine(34) synthetase TilS [Bacillota bacterium]
MNSIYEELVHQLSKDDTVICAVSGGPDSMALLSMLSQVREEVPFCLVCAHVNHNVRKESDEEKEFVKTFCCNHHIIFEYMKIEHYGEDNFHNEARGKRYQFFDELAKKYQAKYVMTAHHGDDLLETILMRIVRGSTLHGYAGFSKQVQKENYLILRPLISVTRDEIMHYLNQNEIAYVTDSSNEKDVYTRNRYRKYIVPELKKEESRVSERFYKFSETLLEYHNYIQTIISEKKSKLLKENKIIIPLFLKEEPLIQRQLLYVLLEDIYQDDFMIITERHVDLMLEVLSSSKPNQVLCLP